MSCTSPGNCTAVGAYFGTDDYAYPFAITESNGVWGTSQAITLPADATSTANPQSSLSSVSCTSAGSCTGVGTYQTTASEHSGFLVSSSAGSFGGPTEVSPPTSAGATGNLGLEGVSCVSTGNCVTVGFDVDSSNDWRDLGMIESGGVWGSAKVVTENGGVSGLSSVSCASDGSCTATGAYVDSSTGYTQTEAVLESSGSWASPTAVPAPTFALADPKAEVNGISCNSSSSCMIGGSDSPFAYWNASVAVESSGTWNAPVRVPLPVDAAVSQSVALDVVSCPPTTTSCVGLEAYQSTHEVNSVEAVDVEDGSWASNAALTDPISATDPSVPEAISCPQPGDCFALAESSGHGFEPIFYKESGGIWDGGTALNISGTLSSISCPSTTWCAMVGTSTATGNQAIALTYSAGVLSPVTDIEAPATPNSDGLTGVSCWAVDECVAIGTYAATYFLSMSVNLTSGGWSASIPVTPSTQSGPNFSLISCPAEGTCLAVSTSGQEISMTDSTWGTPGHLPGTDIGSVSCADASDCVVAGSNYDSDNVSQGFAALGSIGGSFVSVTAVSPITDQGGTPEDTPASEFGVSCATATTCLLVGSTTTPNGEELPTITDTEGLQTPGPPLSVAAISGDGFAPVEWDAPIYNGGSAITSYTATASPGGSTCTWTSGPLTCTVPDLTNGVAYTFTVTATNAEGTGPASSPSKSVTPGTQPGAPTGVTAQPGDGSANVGWTAPSSDGGDQIIAYTATASPGGSSCTWLVSPGGALDCVISGLTNGVTYTVTVAAFNGKGSSPPSSPSAPVTPSAAPVPPSGIVAAPGDGSVQVSWEAPYSEGGSAITSYTATASPGGKTCTWTTGPLECTVTGLTNGVTYTFTVTATNAQGTSLPSAVSWPVIPGTVPGAPTEVAAVPGDGSALVEWLEPIAEGAGPITGYTATASPGGNTCTWTSGDDSCTITGLTNGVSYTFTVTATNAQGTGASSAPSPPVVPATVPGAPTGVVATPGDGSALVGWTSPASEGGSLISAYTVTASPGGNTCSWGQDSPNLLTCTITGLTNGVSYTFTVTATNAQGTGASSAPSLPVVPATVPGIPTGIDATPGDASAQVGWSAPGSDGGSTITSYTVTGTPGGKTCTWAAGPLQCTVSGLTNGVTYAFSVTATNAAGSGTASALSIAVTPATVPQAPAKVQAAAGDGAAKVSWSAPASNGGRAITGYTASATPGGETCAWRAGPLACTVSGLTNGDAYTFSVTATNAVGTGPPASLAAPVTPATAPGAPTNVAISPGVASVAVSWSAPTSDGGSAITGYTATSSPGARSCTTSGTQCVIGGLRPTTPYTFSIVATNDVGSGRAGMTSAMYPFHPNGLGVEVVSSILSRNAPFTVVVGGAKPSALVKVSLAGARGASCTADGFGQCAVSLAESIVGEFVLRASTASSDAALHLWAPSVSAPPNVRLGGVWTVVISRCPSGAVAALSLSDGRRYGARASASGVATFRLRFGTAGRVRVEFEVDGTRVAPSPVLVVT